MPIIEIIIAASIMALGVWLLYMLWWVPRQRRLRELGIKPNTDPVWVDGKADVRSCPLCGTILAGGERVKSAVFPGGKERMTHIFGCPHCYPPNTVHRRICPVCMKEVPREGKVIARMFTSPGRKHVHVLGCSSCRNM